MEVLIFSNIKPAGKGKVYLNPNDFQNQRANSNLWPKVSKNHSHFWPLTKILEKQGTKVEPILCRQVVFDTLGKCMLRFGYTKIKIFGI